MPSYVLGVNLSHDRSTCLLKDGQLLYAIAEERLDRIKHSIGRMLHDRGRRLGPKILPWRGITYCLDAARISLDDVDLLMFDQSGGAVDLEALAHEIPIRDKSRIRSIPHPSHHWAHAYSAYYGSSFEESAILVTDNIGSYLNLQELNEGESGYHANGFEITEVMKTYSVARDLETNSLCLGRVYRMVSLILGFYAEVIARGQLGHTIQILDDAGKTMGLAPYGRKRKDWPPFVVLDPKKDEPQYPHFISWLKKTGLLKLKKQDGVAILDLRFLDPAKSLSRFHRDLAYKVQDEVEQGLVFLANKLYEKTRSRNLCIAGGVGLNSVANYKILKSTSFENIFIQPASTDDGNAVGAAYYGWVHYLGGRTRHVLTNAYLGRSYSQEEIYKSLFEEGMYHFEEYETDELLSKVASWLAQGKIVGWFQGGSEFGPRALGGRSILADPRNRKMKDILNRRVKFRESFRPYAPAVLLEDCGDYFEIDRESPFMLLIAPVRKEKRRVIPAVTHVDGTARLQTVTRSENDRFYDLIARFKQITGVPVLLNTSFNVRGMPIVETPKDAARCFKRSDMDYLVMENIVVEKSFYPDAELERLIPMAAVKVNREPVAKRPKPFWTDLKRQELHRLDAAETRFLSLCDDRKTIAQMRSAFPGKRDYLDFVRRLFRKRLIGFRNPCEL